MALARILRTGLIGQSQYRVGILARLHPLAGGYGDNFSKPHPKITRLPKSG
jgi:hypothetical protein